MKTRKRLLKALAVSALIVTAAIGVSVRRAQAVHDIHRSSGLVGITDGTSLRFAVANIGADDLQAELSIVDGDGKVQIQCDGFIPAGKAFFEDFKHPGGANRLELRAVVRVNNASGSQVSIAPSLQVVNDETGETKLVLGGDGFLGDGSI